MANFKCPFCNSQVPDIWDTHQTGTPRFNISSNYDQKWRWDIEMFRCPSCEKIASIAVGVGSETGGKAVMIFPESSALQFPEYVPKAIRSDYEEACSILYKSPKAAAALARRCLQGMIRDFWEISGKKNLNQEIDAIADKVPASQWRAIDGVRKIGNIGAHMEKDVNLIIDVEPEEAKALLQLIELLIEKWYINRREEEELYASIEAIANEKASLKISPQQDH